MIASRTDCLPMGADFALIKAYLRNNGWALSRKIKTADLVIVNTCAVVKESEDESVALIKKVQKNKNRSAQMLITGCLPSINKNRLKQVFNGTAVSPNSFQELDKILNTKSSISEIKYTGSLRKLKKNKYAEYRLRIGWGCQGKCSYCAVRFVFGKPRSRPILDILKEYDIAYNKGYRRFILIANDSGTYGEDLNISLAHLLDKLCQKYKECRFALSHLTPNKLKEMLPSLERFIRQDKIWRIYVPVCSGSKRILKLMNRSYDLNDFKYCVTRLRNCNPNLEIKTLFLVGLPSETEKDFLDSLKLAEWLISNNVVTDCIAYSSRPNTEASQMPNQIDSQIKQERLKRLSILCSFFNSLNNNKEELLGISNKIS
ncbi:MAG: radical SAM protein [Candidatus Omnitrophota bacterium]|nr:radical SAM protein [Candidatus Omnitrophota bacterium]